MAHNFQAQETYKVAQREFTSSKEIELKIFASITASLSNVDKTAVDGTARLAVALVENAKLWNMIFIDLVNPENALPMPLKESLISLAEYTQKHTIEVLGGNAEHDILIEINQAVMRGLRDSVRAKKATEAETKEKAA